MVLRCCAAATAAKLCDAKSPEQLELALEPEVASLCCRAVESKLGEFPQGAAAVLPPSLCRDSCSLPDAVCRAPGDRWRQARATW